MAKKFISFLGITDYDTVHYIHNNAGMGGYTSKFSQEVLVRTVCRDWGNFDKAIIFLTKEAEKLNWYNKKDESRRLKTLLENTSLNFKGVPIPTGKNEGDIWEIFHIIINNIEEGDRIVLDITHAFRYIPMLATIILDYAKVVKNIEILGIYYGALECTSGTGTTVECTSRTGTTVHTNKRWSLEPVPDGLSPMVCPMVTFHQSRTIFLYQ